MWRRWVFASVVALGLWGSSEIPAEAQQGQRSRRGNDQEIYDKGLLQFEQQMREDKEQKKKDAAKVYDIGAWVQKYAVPGLIGLALVIWFLLRR